MMRGGTGPESASERDHEQALYDRFEEALEQGSLWTEELEDLLIAWEQASYFITRCGRIGAANGVGAVSEGDGIFIVAGCG